MTFLKFWSDDFEGKKGWEGGLVALIFFGFLKRALELLTLFTNVFISNKHM